MSVFKAWEGDERSFDRYTIRIGNDYFSMSHNPCGPQGVNQYVGSYPDIYEAYLGREVKLLSLPGEVQKAIAKRMLF